MERVTGCFLRGHYLPVLCGGRKRGGQTVGCCCCIWMCAREIPPVCPSPPHFTLCKKASHPLFLSLSPPLSPISDRHLIWLIWAFVHLTLLPVPECVCTCACRSVCLILAGSAHLCIWMTLILVCLLALHLCVLTRHFRNKKKLSEGELQQLRWSAVCHRREAELEAARTKGDVEFSWGWRRICPWKRPTVEKVQENVVLLDNRQRTVI